MAHIQERFRNGNDAARGQLLMEMDHYETTLIREERNIVGIQDPLEVRKGTRGTFGRGGPRRLTGGEIAEKELRHYDRADSRAQIQSQLSETINKSHISRHHFQPSQRQHSLETEMIIERTNQPASTRTSTTPQSLDVIIVEPWPSGRVPAESSVHYLRPIEHSNQSSTSHSSHSLPSQSTRQIKRQSVHKSESTQSHKRIRKEV
jgi:hypothetical protein